MIQKYENTNDDDIKINLMLLNKNPKKKFKSIFTINQTNYSSKGGLNNNKTLWLN